MRRTLSLVAVSFGAFLVVLLANSAWCEHSGGSIRVLPGPPVQYGMAAGAGPGACYDMGQPRPGRPSLRPLGRQLPRARRPRPGSEFPATEVERASQTGTPADTSGGADMTGGISGTGTPAAETGGTSTGLDLSGGVGSTSINGLVAGSPRVATESLGLNNGISLGGRVSYNFGSLLQVFADRNRTLFKASDHYKGPQIEREDPLYNARHSSWTSVSRVYLAPGDSVDTTFTVDTTALCARLNLVSLVPGPGRSPFSIGPEVQWVRYESDLKIDNERLDRIPHGRHGKSLHSMVGCGGFAALDFASFTNLNNPYSNSSFAFIPRVKVAASLGDGEGMRFYAWEVLFNVDLLFRRALRRNILNTETFFLPGLRTEISYVHRSFDQYESKAGRYFILDPHGTTEGGPPSKQNNEFDQQSLTFRASVLF